MPIHAHSHSNNTLSLLTFATILSCTLNALLMSHVWKISLLPKKLPGAVPHDFEYARQPSEVPTAFSPSSMVVQLPDTEYPISNDRKWATIVPPQLGFIRLGPEGTPFSIAMFHQLHCVNAIRFAYRGTRDGIFKTPEALTKSFAHANHCFDLLRHAVLCRADTTLTRTNAGNETAVARHCAADHAQVREYVASNQAFWEGVPFQKNEQTEYVDSWES
ncbi:hypothetical protein MSAN_01314300 [Mycena sanguinolenta]|uniref:Oxidase ustYa n=1 Tax=Mycena sanguinolenta TaxID=230812 RepID=A0A8H6YA35_9AGAR|nr:hypothetical protein MSAN_01314300 [Mycena sanguinolenta]